MDQFEEKKTQTCKKVRYEAMYVYSQIRKVVNVMNAYIFEQ